MVKCSTKEYFHSRRTVKWNLQHRLKNKRKNDRKKPCWNCVFVIFLVKIMIFFVSSVYRRPVIARATMRCLIHKEIPRGFPLIKRSPLVHHKQAHRLAQISALTPLFLRHFREQEKNVQRDRNWKETERKRERETRELACVRANVLLSREWTTRVSGASQR